MANTITDLIPDAYAALDVVSRELTGFIPAVARDSRADRVAENQVLRSPYTSANTDGKNITPAMSFPTAVYQTISNRSLSITKKRAFPFSWTGEEQGSLDTGVGFLTIEQDQIAQALRAAVNEIETDIAVAAKNGASRAYGTAGTTPFASTLIDTANVLKILKDNGTPETDLQMVIDTTAGAKIRTLSQLTKVNEAGDSSLLRQGVILDVHGFAIRESAQVQTPTKGTMASATTSNAALTVGQTVLPLATAGTGVVAAGEIITLANDTNKYVVESVSFAGANPASGDTITIAGPGLRVAQSAATRAITVQDASARNIGFRRNAIVLGTRLPMLPKKGDMALDRTVITDPRTGLSFGLAMYGGYHMVHYEVEICWGVTVFKPEHVAVLQG